MIKQVLVFAFVVFLFGASFVFAGTVTTFESNILQPVIQINVPDKALIENSTPGYVSSEDSFLIQNTGTVDVSITPSLVSASDPIYRYLYFRESSGSSRPIGVFSMNISKPSSFPGTNSKTFYYKLDLRNFNGTLTQNLLGYQSDVKFIAVAQ